MANINLHSIFCHLTGNNSFLSTIIEADTTEVKKKNKNKKFNLMANMVTEYIPLSPYETQNYAMFPHRVKNFLIPEYMRLGIKNVMEKDMNVINISFLNSLNFLLRPELYKSNMDEQIRNFSLLENFICHKILRNFQIDRTKNTKKVQAVNKETAKNLLEGKFSHEIIQYIINIFEVNLLVFDMTKMDVSFYWTKGNKYPYLNPFKDIYCMSYIQGNYEPIMTPNNTITEEQKRKLYVYILTNLSEIKCIPEINIGVHTMLYIDTWEIDSDSFIKITNLFFHKKQRNLMEKYEEFIEFEATK